MALTAQIQVNEDPGYTNFKSTKYGDTELTAFYAPLPVFFEGYHGISDNEIVDWRWDFGDGTTARGMTAAHIFETPGDYTVTLTVEGATGATATDTIAVSAWARPAGRTFYYDAVDGDDANDGLSPATAKRTADDAFGTLATGSKWLPGDRILFKRGQTFPMTPLTTGHGRAGMGYTFGAYGDPSLDPPLITYAAASGGALFHFYGVDWAWIGFEDLAFDGTSTDGVRKTLFQVNGRGYQMHFNRCRFQNFYQAVGALPKDLDLEGIGGIFLKDCESYDSDNVHFFAECHRWAAWGGTYDYSANHIYYGGHMDRGWIYRNTYSRPAFGRHAVRVSAERSTVEADGTFANGSHHVHVLENRFEGWIDPRTGGAQYADGTRYNFTLVEVKPSTGKSQVIHDILVEDNVFTDCERFLTVAAAERVTVKNNIMRTPDTYEGADRILVGHALANRPCKDIRFLANTIVSDESRGHREAILAVEDYAGPAYPGLTHHENIVIDGNDITMRNGTTRVLRVGGQAGLKDEIDSDNQVLRGDMDAGDVLYQIGGTWNSAGSAEYTLAQWTAAEGEDLFTRFEAALDEPTVPDLSAPAQAMSAPITVTYSGARPATGYKIEAVKLWVKAPGAASFVDSGLSGTGLTGSFAYTPDAGDGTYGFAAQVVQDDGSATAEPTAAQAQTSYNDPADDTGTKPGENVPDPPMELETVLALLLVPDTAVAQLVGNAVKPASLPPKETYDGKAPALIVLPTPGAPPDEETPHSVLRVQIRCLGGTANLADAYDVFYALRQRLRKVRMEATPYGVVLSVTAENQGIPYLNPQTQWWEVLTAWRFSLKPA